MTTTIPYQHERKPGWGDATVTYHHCTVAQRLSNGGACSMLVRRVGGVVQLLPHSSWEAAAELTDEQARAVGQALIDAAGTR